MALFKRAIREPGDRDTTYACHEEVFLRTGLRVGNIISHHRKRYRINSILLGWKDTGKIEIVGRLHPVEGPADTIEIPLNRRHKIID